MYINRKEIPVQKKNPTKYTKNIMIGPDINFLHRAYLLYYIKTITILSTNKQLSPKPFPKEQCAQIKY